MCLSNESLDKIKRNIELQKKTDFLNFNRIGEAAELINSILEQYNSTEFISVEDIHFTPNYLRDPLVPDRTVTEKDGIIYTDVSYSSNWKLSQAIFNLYYQKPNEESYYHYTKVSALRKILCEKKLKLNPLFTNENEFNTFYKDHNINGYFENRNPEGEALVETLKSEIYSLCFASKTVLIDDQEKHLWSSFADKAHGVRIEFNIRTEHPDFRKVYYKHTDEQNSDLPLFKLESEIQKNFGVNFVFSGISKIGAFYLPGDYKVENEVRFVVKKHTDEYDFYYDDSSGSILLPFENEYAHFEVRSIKIGESATVEEIELIKEIIQDSEFSMDILE